VVDDSSMDSLPDHLVLDLLLVWDHAVHGGSNMVCDWGYGVLYLCGFHQCQAIVSASSIVTTDR